MITYFCIEDFRTIKKGDIVKVHIYTATDQLIPLVHIKNKLVVHCTNEFILAMHFKKLGGKKNG